MIRSLYSSTVKATPGPFPGSKPLMILWLVAMFALWMALGAASSVRADDTNLDTGVSIVEQPVFDKATEPAPAAALGGWLRPTAILVDSFPDYSGNLHPNGIAFDGTYYWVVGGGGTSGTVAQLRADFSLVATQTVALDCRSAFFNSSDGQVYIKAYTGNGLYRLHTSPFDGGFDTVYTGIFQNQQTDVCSLPGAKYMYDQLNGSVLEYAFVTGNVTNEFSLSLQYDPVSPQGYLLAHSGSYLLTLANEKVYAYSTYNGAFMGSSSLPGVDLWEWSMSYTNGLFFATNVAENWWYAFRIDDGLPMTLRVPSEYPTIKAALDISAPGDTILVAPATYSGSGFRDLNWSSHWFVLKSEEGPENTIIDLGGGEGDRRFLYVDYYADSSRIVFDGFTFRNSHNMFGAGSVLFFEGVAPTVTDCIFYKNYGSAIYFTRSNAKITDCRFVDNQAQYYGGAVSCETNSGPTFTNCSFVSNHAGYGGGAVYSVNNSYPEFNYCTFDENSAAAYGGGAVMCRGWSDVALYYCTMVNNSGKYGGAVYLQEMLETSEINKQPDAIAAGRNGGNYIEHCIIAFGTGVGAVYRDISTPSLYISCTDIYSNEGGDWIEGYLGVNGNVLLDPQFCDAPAGNYMLMSSSPCVAANNSCGQMGAFGVGCQTMQLVVEPSALTFQADHGGANPPVQSLSISATGAESFTWTVTKQFADWLFLSTEGGTGPGTVIADAHTSSLPIGQYNGVLAVVSPEAVNSPVHIPVALTIIEPEPVTVAAFSGSPLSGPAPLTVTFTDLSTGGVDTWHWDFGDGESDTAQNPVHIYTQPGPYAVTLVATGPYGPDTMMTEPDYIDVSFAPPVADFTADTTSGEAPLTVQFTDLSTGDVAVWFWDFGDEDFSIVQHPSHVYDTAGLYTVSLSVVGPGGDVDTETEVDYIDVLRPNSPPEFVNPCPDAALVEGDPYHCLITAGDPDEDSLSFTWNGIPAGAAFIDNNDGTADFSFTPDYSHVDLEHTAVFEVTDGKVTVPDTTIFTVSNRQLQAQVPTSGEDRLITDKPIVIGFNEAIRESSLAGNVTLTSAEGDALTYSYAADRYQLQVNNSSDYLKELDMIVITLETGISDSAGYGIDQKYVDTVITGVGVYPGDANDDGGVDERDILPLGLYWNLEGPPRPDDSNLTWGMTAAHVFNDYHRWNPPASVHADCDGSGRIDASDICGVAANWSQTQGSARNHDHSEMVASLAQVDQDVLQELYDALINCPDGGAGKESIGGMIESLLEDRQASLPTTTELYQNYPNPFNPQTVIRFFLPRSGRVNLSVYNIVGRKVSTLLKGRVSEGYTEVVWDGVDQSGRLVASGIYFYRIESENVTITRRMLLLK